MALTAEQILKSSLPSVKEAARYCYIKEDATLTPTFRKSSDKKAHGAPKLLAVVYSTALLDGTPKPKSRKYKAFVAGKDNTQKLSVGPVIVGCQCDYFTFHCEVALAKKGAALITQSNGERPSITNPRLIPTPCKHLYKLLSAVVKRRM